MKPKTFAVVMVLWFTLILVAGALAQQTTVPTPNIDPAKLPLVKILATGGTIVNIGTRQNFSGMSGKDLIDSIPDLARYARVDVEQVVNLPSSKLTPDVWLGIAKRINEILTKGQDVAGVVVTHGTDTMEETAYFLNLTVRSEKPVIVTGAQIQKKHADSDGTRNLISAVRLAADPAARGKGAMIVFNERQILASRFTSKTNTMRVDGFGGGEMGMLGVIDEDGVWFYNIPTRKHTAASEFDISRLDKLPEVGIVYSYAGAGGGEIEGLTNRGVKGIVLAGTGAGGTSPANIEAAKVAMGKGIVFVTTTRVREGRVREEDVDAGLRGDNLSPQKARILLMLALAKTNDLNAIQRFFDEY